MRDAGLGGAPPLPGSCSLTWSYLGVGARSSNSESMAGESRVGGRSRRQQNTAGRASRTTGVSLSGLQRGQVHVQGARSSVSETLSPRLAEGHLPPVSSRGRERALVSLSRGPHPQDLAWPSSPPQARLHAPSPWGSGFGVRRCRLATPVLEGVLCIQREWRFTGHWSLVVPQCG